MKKLIKAAAGAGQCVKDAVLSAVFAEADAETKECIPKGTKIYGRPCTTYENVAAVATGHYRRCQMGGCGSLSIRVQWPDGEIRWLCYAGLTGKRGPNKRNWGLA